MNTKSALNKITGPLTINGTTYDQVVLLAAPFEKQDVVRDTNVLMDKLASGIDDLIADQLGDPNFIFCTALPLDSVPESEKILNHCEYEKTDNTIIAIRAFGLINIGADGIADFVEHISCKITFAADKVLFMTNRNEDDETADNTESN